MTKAATTGVNLEGLDQAFRLLGKQEGMTLLRNRIADYYMETDPKVAAFLKEMEKYDKPKLKGSPASGKNKERIVKHETFIDRVKAIITKAATKNGQRMESNARGHAGAYLYNINADVFCKAVDKLADVHEKELKEYLGGSMNKVQVTKVCQFIGNVVRMHIINDSQLQLTDMAFAFNCYYKSETVRAKLSVKDLSYAEKDFFNFFESLLKGIKSVNNRE